MLEDKFCKLRNRILIGRLWKLTLDHFMSSRLFVLGICLIQSLYRS